MSTKQIREEDSTLKALQDAIKQILRDPDATVDQKIKAIEAGAKLVTARSKDRGDDSNFFDK